MKTQHVQCCTWQWIQCSAIMTMERVQTCTWQWMQYSTKMTMKHEPCCTWQCMQCSEIMTMQRVQSCTWHDKAMQYNNDNATYIYMYICNAIHNMTMNAMQCNNDSVTYAVVYMTWQLMQCSAIMTNVVQQTVSCMIKLHHLQHCTQAQKLTKQLPLFSFSPQHHP